MKLILPILIFYFSFNNSYAVEDRLEVTFMPYLFVPKMKTTLGVGNVILPEKTLSPSDVIDDVDMFFEGYLLIMYGEFGFMSENIYFNLSGDSGIVNIRPSLTAQSSGDVKEWMWDHAIVYQNREWTSLKLFGGVRYFQVSMEVKADETITPGPLPPVDFIETGTYREHWFEGLVGIIYDYDLDEQWQLNLKSDFGYGDKEQFSSLQRAGVTYFIKDNIGLFMGFQYIFIKKDDSDVYIKQKSYNGMLGLTFKF
ncbi:MAG: hypothetical protein MK193_13205 [Lentisphaeria bacterium]|nr:hypothetical protein [Lentisphaeria bacterium]